MQIPLRTQSSVEAYIAGQEWRDVCLHACPLHPSGGCSFARHGSYARVTPQGVRIARWYCPEGHRTFSLLPDFLAVRLPGLLTDVEHAVSEAHSARSLEAAADMLRGFEITLPSALRWLRRRVRTVQTSLDTLSRLLPPASATVAASDSALQLDTGQGNVLLGLRCSLPLPFLYRLAAPLGFQSKQNARDGTQHDMGPDDAVEAVYAATSDVRYSPCNRSPPMTCQQLPFRRLQPCVVSGARIAACETAAPTSTCDGSDGSVSTAHNANSTNEPS